MLPRDPTSNSGNRSVKEPTLLQRAFNAFMKCSNSRNVLDSSQLGPCALQTLLDSDIQLDLKVSESAKIAAMINEDESCSTLEFQDFYNVFTSFNVFKDIGHGKSIDPHTLSTALRERGHRFTEQHVLSMLPKGNALSFALFLDMYMERPRFTSDEFLSDWLTSTKSQLKRNQTKASLSPIEDFWAGTFAGVVLTLTGHPFDTVKVRLQTAAEGRFRGGVHCATQTISKEGVRGIYKGMGGPMMTVPLINAVVFAAYGQAKSFLQGEGEQHALSIGHMSMAGAFAGAVNSFIVCPVEHVKTLLQLQYTSHGSVSGPLDCTKKLFKDGGIRAIFRGLNITIVRETSGYAAQFCAYEYLKRVLTPEDTPTAELSAPRLMLAGGFAGIIAWIVSYPADYIKSQIQAVPIGSNSPFPQHRFIPDGGAISCFRQTLSQHGFRHIWTGFGPCLARAFPANAAGFLAFEFASKMIRRIRSDEDSSEINQRLI